MKRDGTASDKRDVEYPSTPLPLSQSETPVDEPIAGKPQTTASSKISTLRTEVLDSENIKRQTISQPQFLLTGTAEVRFRVPATNEARYAHIVSVAQRFGNGL